jgi:hypothetical protein
MCGEPWLVFKKILGFRRNQMADKTERNQNLEKDHEDVLQVNNIEQIWFPR